MMDHITVAIHTDQHFGPILVGSRSLSFADASHMRFMKAINLVRNMDTAQPLLGLLNHSLDQFGVRFKFVFQSLNRTSRFVCSLGVKISDLFLRMLNHLRNSFHHLLSISAELTQPSLNALLSVFSQLMNLYNHLLTQPAKTANSFYPFYSMTRQSPDTTHQSMPSSVKKLCIRWILNVLGLSRRIHKLTSRTDPLLRNQDLSDRLFQFSESFCSQTTSKLGHGGRIQKPTKLHFALTPPSGLQLHSTEAHPVDVLVQPLNNLLIGKIKTVLQYMQPHHQSNLLRPTPSSTIIREQSID